MYYYKFKIIYVTQAINNFIFRQHKVKSEVKEMLQLSRWRTNFVECLLEENK